MYKICTLLSTDNVDNALEAATVVARKALLGAVSGATASPALAWRTMTHRNMKARMPG